MFQAGAASVIITPPIGVELAGYSFGPNVGVLDNLEAQALAIRNQETTVGILTVDLLTVGAEFVARIRARAERELGIPGTHLAVAASHSHSSPTAYPLRQWGRVDEGYVAQLEDTLIGALRQALEQVREVRLRTGLGRCENLSENRRGQGALRDLDVPVILAEEPGGVPVAVLFSFGCHPVTLHGYRNLLSPDYPDYARKRIRSRLGGPVVALFSMGAAGDINPAGYVHGAATEERARRLGEPLGDEVARAAGEALAQDDAVLQAIRSVIELPVHPLPPLVELDEQFRIHSAETEQLRREGQPWERVAVAEIKRDWALEAAELVRSGRAKTSVSCEVQVFRIGDLAFLAAPLEIFSETSLAIKRESHTRVTFICSNANGGVGYLATADAYRGKDYTNPTGLAPKVYGIYTLAQDAEPTFRSAAIQLVNRLFPAPPRSDG